jgi:glycosyltransferase involved in cell wall biosynthesis
VGILEAMAHGVPVVISKECHFEEVQHHGAGFEVPLDPMRIAAAICEILDDPGLRRTMGERARKVVCQQYLWTSVANKTVETYRELARF